MACGREGLSDNYITIMEQRIQYTVYTVYRADTRHGNMNAGHLSTDTWAAASEDGEYGVRVLLDTARRIKQSYTFQHRKDIKQLMKMNPAYFYVSTFT